MRDEAHRDHRPAIVAGLVLGLAGSLADNVLAPGGGDILQVLLWTLSTLLLAGAVYGAAVQRARAPRPERRLSAGAARGDLRSTGAPVR